MGADLLTLSSSLTLCCLYIAVQRIRGWVRRTQNSPWTKTPSDSGRYTKTVSSTCRSPVELGIEDQTLFVILYTNQIKIGVNILHSTHSLYLNLLKRNTILKNPSKQQTNTFAMEAIKPKFGTKRTWLKYDYSCVKQVYNPEKNC